jgi:hypothetical protein
MLSRDTAASGGTGLRVAKRNEVVDSKQHHQRLAIAAAFTGKSERTIMNLIGRRSVTSVQRYIRHGNCSERMPPTTTDFEQH